MAKAVSPFAERLRTLREAAGLSQYALAKRSGLSKQSLSKLEMGESEPTWETVQKLALVLGADCREFTYPAMTVPGEAAGELRLRGRPPKATPAPPPAGNLEEEAAAGQRKARPARGRKGK